MGKGLKFVGDWLKMEMKLDWDRWGLATVDGKRGVQYTICMCSSVTKQLFQSFGSILTISEFVKESRKQCLLCQF